MTADLDARKAAFDDVDTAGWDARVSGVRERSLHDTDEIEHLHVRLREAERHKDEFLAMLGHELRNPLAPIVTALQLLKLKGAAGEREHQVIERQVERLVRLVDDLLDLSRITHGEIKLRKSDVELLPIVRRALHSVSPLLEQRAHTLKLTAAETDLVVHGDSMRLEQIVANILDNAAKYTEPGGRIDIRVARSGGEVEIAVRDTGIGMTPDLLARIFDVFSQGERTVDRRAGGLGIGLSIVRSLVELHDGRVTATSEGLGRGSELCVTLPLVARSSAKCVADRHSVPPVEEPDGRRVLIVDDNADAAKALADGLRWHGYRVRVAYDAPTALAAARQFLPELALIDIGLPVMDGYELAGALRALPDLDTIRLIAVTGYGEERDRLRSEAVGIERHMVKPVMLEDVRAALGDD